MRERLIKAMKKTMVDFWEEFGTLLNAILYIILTIVGISFVITMALLYPFATLVTVIVLCVGGVAYCFIRSTISNYRRGGRY